MSTVILLAHMDDEVFAVPYIEQLALSNSKVQFFYLTKSEGRNNKFSQDVREKESLKFLHKFFPDLEPFFLGRTLNVSDRELHLKLHIVYSELKSLIDPNTSIIISPHFEGGHIDHDSVAILAKMLAKNLNLNSYTFSLYRAKFKKLTLFEVQSSKEKKADAIAVKRKLKSLNLIFQIPFIYRSQWRTWIGIFPFLVYKSVVKKDFWLFNSMHFNHHDLPNNGKVLYSNRKDGLFEDWKVHIKNFIDSIS